MLGVSNTKVLKIAVEKCKHLPQPIRRIGAVNLRSKISDFFVKEHGGYDDDYKVWCLYKNEDYDLEKELTFGEVDNLFGIDNITYKCLAEYIPANVVEEDKEVLTDAGASSKNERSAWSVLMGDRQLRKRSFPSEKMAGNRKVELFNELLKEFKSKNLDFAASTVETEGRYCLDVLCNALWYITNDQQTIADRCKHVSGLIPVPKAYENYIGYNDIKRKKVKSNPLNRETLSAHSEALYGILLKPYMRSSTAWTKEAENIELLAKCLHNYAEYLKTQNEKMKVTINATSPARTLDSDTNIEYREQQEFVDDRYNLIESALKEAGVDVPVIFDEDLHLRESFQNNVQRFRFFSELRLSIPVDILRFSPGGSAVTIACLVYRKAGRSESIMLTDGAQMLQKMKHNFKEFHTRAQKRIFKNKVKDICNINSGLLEEVYKELSFDAAASSHPETGERIRAILLGETGLLCDMRHLNPGRASGTFDVFFEKMGSVIESLIAADDRRHGQAHMSEFISLKDLIDRVSAKCPPETPIPSKSLVRLQFTPTNPYSKTALAFSSRFPVQHKIQRRQLRVAHPDSHYCAALFKYFRSRAVESKPECVAFFCDDKAKISVGEPEAAVSTGVRGRMSIMPTTSTLVALDHDVHKASLTPNVVLECQVPDAVDKSFVRGKVTISVSDSVFQSSDPFRHGAMLCNILREKEEVPPVLMKFTDGGCDQRNNLEKVKCATICLFKEFNFDMIITGRCAPGQSYTNPCERVMSLLNLALQNCATEREKCESEIEKQLKKCKSMDSIRNVKDQKVKEGWIDSLKAVQRLVESRFERLKLKDEPINCTSPVTEMEVRIFERHLKELFPTMDVTKLQKAHTSKIDEYNKWKSLHCIENHYLFMIRKCENFQCCAPSRLPRDRLHWLPSPLIDESGEHYKSYDSVKFTNISDEKDRPSLKVIKPPKTMDSNNATEDSRSSAAHCSGESGTKNTSGSKQVVALSAQNARAQVICVECSKPRVIYCNNKLDVRHKMMLAKALSEYQYTCGSHLFPPDEKRKLALSLVLRPNLQCAMQVEVPYYASDVGRKDICSHCGMEDTMVNLELKKSFKTVLPVCNDCVKVGKKTFTQRPYGKSAKK